MAEDIKENEMTSVSGVDYVRGLRGNDSVLIALNNLFANYGFVRVNQRFDAGEEKEINLSLELCSNMVIQRQPYVVSLNVTLKHWMTICGECQKNNVLFEGYIHIYLCIDILCQRKIPNWQHV